MTKSFKNFRIQFGSNTQRAKSSDKSKPVYKYSVYMQSKDSAWINRNIRNDDDIAQSNEQEPLND